jgi:hypothetical protein
VSNDDLADLLDETADLLAAQGANPFRVRAYRSAAGRLRKLLRPASEILAAEGIEGLERLPGIGQSLASLISELVTTGRAAMLDRLRGQVSPEDLLATVPGIAEELARRIHDELHVETLEELELAAHDGRLEGLTGFGPRRVRGVRESLAGILSRSSRRHARRLRHLERERAGRDAPSVAALLEVDAEYRRKAGADALRTIAPRRFNPSGESWLPVLHTERGDWSFTALYSNTARAHELGKTHEWVVVYYERDGHEDQCTVVTEMSGPLRGSRVVRGREVECRDLYANSDERSERRPEQSR